MRRQCGRGRLVSGRIDKRHGSIGPVKEDVYNRQENAREILKNLGSNIDVVAGIFDDTMLKLRQCAGLELSRQQICCAVSDDHRLAGKERLSISDLYGENFLMMHRGWSSYVDCLLYTSRGWMAITCSIPEQSSTKRARWSPTAAGFLA